MVCLTWYDSCCGASACSLKRKGGIDAGEDPAAAAKRELEEETGVKSARVVAEVGRLRSRCHAYLALLVDFAEKC